MAFSRLFVNGSPALPAAPPPPPAPPPAPPPPPPAPAPLPPAPAPAPLPPERAPAAVPAPPPPELPFGPPDDALLPGASPRPRPSPPGTVFLPAPPAEPVAAAPGAPGEPVEPTDDYAAALAFALANQADLSDLPGLELLDPFGVQEFAVANPPLKGGGALSAIAQACSDYGIDALAAVADSIHEGANGGIGDNGTSFGPFQLHIGGALPAALAAHGRNSPITNAWAWTENGIRYAIRGMATARPSAKGLRGHAAVAAIVNGFERPADLQGAYRVRALEYDKLVRLGSGWAQYAAPLFHGPAAGGAIDTGPIASGTEQPYRPAGVVSTWRDLVDTFKLTVPHQRGRVDSLAKSLVEVFR